ncbi:MAG: hypothetical protein H6560_11505 [Lewinellaceae bacterium]|nr:hypothetical protein [Lewinellaceae bacterium]
MKIEGTIIVLFCLLQGHAHGQPLLSPNAGPGLRMPADTVSAEDFICRLPSLLVLPSGNKQEFPGRQWGPEVRPMPSAYSYDELGVFCKWEVQMEKAARMPVKFRLGEVQYVERMEGKLPDY